MLPERQIVGEYASSEPLYAPFIPPDNRVTSTLEDWERGGVALEDASQGLDVKDWKLWVDGREVYLQPEDGPAQVIFVGEDISEVSLAFDQAMRYTVAYMQHDKVHLRWYDTIVDEYVIDEFPGMRCPRVGTDEKRTNYVADSDIIFAYIKPGNPFDSLCFRAQRDRFGIEYVIREELFPGCILRNIGMNIRWRFQFELAISVEAG